MLEVLDNASQLLEPSALPNWIGSGGEGIFQAVVHGLLVFVRIVVEQHLLDLSDSLAGIQSLIKQAKKVGTPLEFPDKRPKWGLETYLGARLGTIHDSVTAIHGPLVLHLFQAFEGIVIARISHPTVGV